MYAVRTKSGRVVGRFATRAEAEACVRQTSKSPAGTRLRSNSKAYIELRRRAFEWLIAPRRPEGALTGGGYGLSREQAEKLLATRYAQRVLAIVGLTMDEKVARIADQSSWKHSPVRGPARTRLLKVHADVSRKLWAKSPTYPRWTQSYSNEDFDRTQRFAVEMADNLRKRGLLPPGRGYTNETFEAARKAVHAAKSYGAKSPMARGLKEPPPPGTKVRLTGSFLKSTGQQRGGEGASRWTVLGNSGAFVIVNEEADTRWFTPEELAADPSPKWRRINRANLEIVGAKPKAGDYP